MKENVKKYYRFSNRPLSQNLGTILNVIMCNESNTLNHITFLFSYSCTLFLRTEKYIDMDGKNNASKSSNTFLTCTL
jgi:hypothetical protein